MLLWTPFNKHSYYRQSEVRYLRIDHDPLDPKITLKKLIMESTKSNTLMPIEKTCLTPEFNKGWINQVKPINHNEPNKKAVDLSKLNYLKNWW